jgi:glycosyltransferase involved in cell wall biosynthesis
MESNVLGYFFVKFFARRSSHVIGVRGYLNFSNQFFARVFKRAVRASNLVILNSSQLVNYFSDRLTSHPNVLTISNAVAMRSPRVSKPDSRITITVLSNFYDYKGHDLLLNALMKLDISISVHFIGDGPELIRIQQLSSELPKNIEPIFHGQAMDPFTYLESSDFLILPSRHEGFPNAVLEAMSVGLPVIGFNIAGVNELVINEQTGILIKPFDVVSMAIAIERLATDSNFRQQLGKNAYSRAEEFSWSSTSEKFSLAFSSVLRSQ